MGDEHRFLSVVQVYDSIVDSPWRVIGAVVQGASHARTGQPCQDAQAYRRLPDGELLIAVADGAGSAERSELGARLAVDTALNALSASLVGSRPHTQAQWEDLLREVFVQTRQAVQDLSTEDGFPLRQYATTLTVVVAAAGCLASAQVGDGAVVVLDASGKLFAATHLQKGEYANETHFLTQPDLLEHLEVQVCRQPVSALAVMSDGLVRLALKMPSGEPHFPFFQPLFGFAARKQSETQAAEQLADFLASERVCARTDDDKTLVLASYTASTALVPFKRQEDLLAHGSEDFTGPPLVDQPVSLPVAAPEPEPEPVVQSELLHMRTRRRKPRRNLIQFLFPWIWKGPALKELGE